LREAESGGRAVPQVVFFSQFETEAQQQIDQAAIDFRASTDRHKVFIKPHPRERDPKSIYARAEAAGVEILSPTDNSYRILETTDAAVTVFSTLATEALVYPCRSIVLKSRNWSEPIESLVTQGYLESAADGKDLARVLAQPTQFQDRREIGRKLFGVGEPDLDFETLIEQCCRQAPHGRGRVA
jgi:hypothetical protein